MYVFYTLELPPESVQKVESALNITDEVIRFLIVKPDLKAFAKAEAMRAKKAEQAAKRGDQADDSAREDDDAGRSRGARLSESRQEKEPSAGQNQHQEDDKKAAKAATAFAPPRRRRSDSHPFRARRLTGAGST